MYRSPVALGKAVKVLLALWIPMSAFGLYALVRYRQSINDLYEGRTDIFSALDAEDTANAYAVLHLLLFVATVIVFLIWFHRCYTNITYLSGHRTEHSSGWAVGAWFVPFLNFVRPYQMTQETWGRSAPPGGEWSKRSTLIALWWGALLFSRVVMTVISTGLQADYQAALDAPFSRDVRGPFMAMNAAEIFGVFPIAISAALGYLVVTSLTARQHDTAAVLAAQPHPVSSGPQ